VTYGSSGVYGTVHVPAEMLAKAAGVKLRHVPYTGGGPLMQAMLGQQIDITLLPRSSSMSQIRSGRVRPLVVLGSERWGALPDTPTTAELGLDVDYLPWTGLMAPEGTPEAIVSRLRAAASQAVRSPVFIAAVEKSGGTPAYLDAPDFAKFWTGEVSRLNDIIKLIGKME
jgi:tripartite-type tricarboxylate transporter receptor subunit TctC